jgi:hypothetical protein
VAAADAKTLCQDAANSQRHAEKTVEPGASLASGSVFLRWLFLIHHKRHSKKAFFK